MDALAVVPNPPLEDVPVGRDEHDNLELRKVGRVPPRPDWAKEHFEIGEALREMDFERAARLSGSRFTVLRGRLARLERALGQFMLDLHTTEHGYTEVQLPLMVRTEVMHGTGQLPKFAEDLYVATSPAPGIGPAFIDYDLIQPGPKTFRLPAIAQLPIGPHKRRLQRIIGVLHITQHAQGKTGIRITITRHQPGICISVSRQHGRDYLGVRSRFPPRHTR